MLSDLVDINLMKYTLRYVPNDQYIKKQMIKEVRIVVPFGVVAWWIPM